LIGLLLSVGIPVVGGVISTCNYVARRYGVHSAMSSAYAKQLCPDLIFLSSNMSLYKKVSAQMREIFIDYSDCIEFLSIDEAYLDVSHSKLFGGSATLIALDIQQRIKRELQLSVSAGVSSKKYIAKIASDWRKPHGIFTVSPDQILDF
jgi:DNA polymerase-4